MKYGGFILIVNYICCIKIWSIVVNWFICLLFVENWFMYFLKVYLFYGVVVIIVNGKGKRL